MTTSLLFFNATATTEIYTLSLHDALPILLRPTTSLQGRLALRIAEETGKRPVLPPARQWSEPEWEQVAPGIECKLLATDTDRKSTRLNSSHGYISYAVFCLKKKRNTQDDS